MYLYIQYILYSLSTTASSVFQEKSIQNQSPHTPHTPIQKGGRRRRRRRRRREYPKTRFLEKHASQKTKTNSQPLVSQYSTI